MRHLSVFAVEREELSSVDERTGKAFAKAVGEQLQRAREAHGWSRLHMVQRMPSGIGERTLLAYEHGLRQLTLIRLAELAHILEIDAPAVYARGLQQTELYLKNLTLQVDLNALLDDKRKGRAMFRPLRQWVRNTLNEHPDGVVEIDPAAVKHLALFMGCSHHELAQHLARFTPEDDEQESD
jgi:transcriptional regulator with XRE-family HTH domain